MNIHMPQSLQTRNELEQLAAVPYQILTPKDSKPIVSIVQDIALGVYRMTKSTVFVTEKQLFNLMATNPKFTGNIPRPLNPDANTRMWSGRQMLSTIIPPNVNYRGQNKSYDDNKGHDEENFVVIENGEIKGGRIDTKIYQDRTKGLIHSIYNEYGPKEATIFLDNTQQLVCNWLVKSGFSVGISDLIIDNETSQSIKDVIHKMKVDVFDIIKDVHMGSYVNDTRISNTEKFERDVNQRLNEATNRIGKIGLSKIDDLNNRLLNMIKSGSKGNPINIAQTIGCLGQQNIDGQRIGYGYDNRTLPHYTKFDDGPESRGFVENSFIKGLTPQEFFFHAMGGREGLIDTAVKSVTYDTPIVVIENGESKRVLIGEWIDDHIDRANKDIVKHYPNDRNMELLDIEPNTVWIPTMNEKGVVTWGELTAVTRHDPGNALYKVTTESGRTVTVAESQSLLVWDENRQGFYEKPSPDVKEGDFMASLVKLPEPPVSHCGYIDMVKYLPKSEYVYGTEFNIARRMVEEVMESPTTKRLDNCKNAGDRVKVPQGWWAANNGVNFTLPYPKKAGITRAINKKKTTDNIKDGFIYPYKATRRESQIPDKFELSYENGVFIGLFLADGNTHGSSIHITKENAEVRKFVEGWFEKYHMNYRTISEQRDIGISTSIIGGSVMLTRFLDKFVGSGARNKYVPDVAFAGPLEFARGIVSGYYSGDGSVGKNYVDVNSSSKRLIEGIQLLCNRFGIFGSVSTRQQTKTNLNIPIENVGKSYAVRMPVNHAYKFKKQFKLIEPAKQERLSNIVCDQNKNYKYDDMGEAFMFDPVKKIEVLGVEDHPKLYDVTVPSTLNFIVGSGIAVKDTSSTGYVQRKLVKAMEDCKVSYDLTVRNANGNIVQFLYGEDGIDAIKIEHQPLPYITMTPQQLEEEYLLSVKQDMSVYLLEDAFKEFKQEDWETRMFDHYTKILEDREFIITKMFEGQQETSVLYPIGFQRIINNTKVLYSKYNMGEVKSDLNPCYVLDTIEKLCEELHVTSANKGNKLLGMLLRMYLSPKQMIVKNHFSKAAFEQIVSKIRMRYFDSIVNPSEMVGVVAAQSIGEPCTQLSCLKTSKVLISTKDKTKTFYGNMGDFVDNILSQNKDNVVDLGNDSVVFDPKEDYYVVGVSDKEKTSWRRILQVSRHPAHGGMVRVHTKSGKTTCATLSHSFLKRTVDSIVPVKGSDLKVGNRIPVAKFIPTIENPLTNVEGFELDKDFGWFVGMYFAGGCLYGCEKKMKEFIVSNFETIPGWVFNSNIEFIKGIIAGYFDGNGNVCFENTKDIKTTCSFDEIVVDGLIMLLTYVGIFASKIKENYVGIFASKINENINKMYSIQISAKYARTLEQIGLAVDTERELITKLADYADEVCESEYVDKIPELGELIAFVNKELGCDVICDEDIGRSTLINYIDIFETAAKGKHNTEVENAIVVLKQAANSDVVWDEIVKIEYLDDPEEYVYDFTVPGNDSFMVDCGVLVHNTLNTFHLSGTQSASKAVRGVPRIEELTRVTKNSKAPSMTIFVKPQYNQNQEKCMEIKNMLEITTFKDIIKSSRIYFEPNDLNTGIEADRRLIELYQECDFEESKKQMSPWLLRMELDKMKMLERGLTMIDLHHKLFDHYSNRLSCMFSDDNAGDLIFRIRLYEDGQEDKNDMLTEMKALESTLVENMLVQGIDKVNKVELIKKDALIYNEDSKVFEKVFEWCMDTDGTNLLEILGHPFVDETRTYSNDVNEIYSVFGVEAARQCLFNELNKVIKDAETSINFRHLSLLVDTMTLKGNLMSIDRHGINKGDIGPLAKCSFEEVNDVLVKAGVFSEVDRVNGVSSNIILGQLAPCGTGDTDILIDEQLLAKPVETYNREKAFAEMDNDVDEMCHVDNLEFDFAMPEIDTTIKKKADVKVNLIN